jgi:tRNA (mo5U34)-methyltransferase
LDDSAKVSSQGSSLSRQATEFWKRAAAIKSGISLRVGQWYPYDSIGSFLVLDEFLAGDLQTLRALAGPDPILDIGCGDGDVSFFLESLGFAVRAIDYPRSNNNAMYGVHVLKQALGSHLEIQSADIDERLDLPEPHYGLTLLLGVLYHLKNPYQVLETLAKKSRYCFLSTRIAALAPDKKKTQIGNLPVAYLLDEAEINDDDSNYWIFSETGLRRILKRAGWTVRNWHTTGCDVSKSDPVSTAGDSRAFCLLESRVANRPESLALAGGWHDLEFGAWRWTERRFSVRLATPPHDEPVTLRFGFHLPPQVAASRPTLSATVNGMALQSETYSGAGHHQYVRSVPASALAPGNVAVEFELDRALGPTETDERELGVLVDFSGGAPVVLR